MRKMIVNAILTMALFCGTAFADGNMGGSGYTDCNGTNPPPTCPCNAPNPPASCSGGGGFANYEEPTEVKSEDDLTSILNNITVYILEMF